MFPQGIGQLTAPQQMPQQPAPPQAQMQAPVMAPQPQMPDALSGIGLNLIQAQDRLKDAADGQLVQYLQTGDGPPPALVLSELNRRKRMRDASAQPPQSTVADELITDTMQRGIGAMAPRMGMAYGGRVPYQRGGATGMWDDPATGAWAPRIPFLQRAGLRARSEREAAEQWLRGSRAQISAAGRAVGDRLSAFGAGLRGETDPVQIPSYSELYEQRLARSQPRPADVAPAGVAPAGVAPAGVAPADVAPADVAPAGVAPAGVAPPSLAEQVAPEQAIEEVQEAQRRGINLPLMAMGLSMMASNNPRFAGALGEAGLAGLSAYISQQEQAEAQRMREAGLSIEERRLGLTERDVATRERMAGIREQQLDAMAQAGSGDPQLDLPRVNARRTMFEDRLRELGLNRQQVLQYLQRTWAPKGRGREAEEERQRLESIEPLAKQVFLDELLLTEASPFRGAGFGAGGGLDDEDDEMGGFVDAGRR